MTWLNEMSWFGARIVGNNVRRLRLFCASSIHSGDVESHGRQPSSCAAWPRDKRRGEREETHAHVRLRLAHMLCRHQTSM